jgi:DNA repair protein RadA/Sms
LYFKIFNSLTKSRSIFICQQCGAQSPKWIGKCPACGEWNSYVEEVEQATSVTRNSGRTSRIKSTSRLIGTIDPESQPRVLTHDKEFNRVLGGGMVAGSLVLIGGEPGIGKSTLLLQVAVRMKETAVLYISGEESPEQIKSRADRFGMHESNCFLLNETNIDDIFSEVERIGPRLLIIDSIQTIYSSGIESSPGSISQVRHCAVEFMKYAKETGTPVLLIGHITKEGTLAGPKVLEHIVDTVLQFEGEKNTSYRILRSMKNRFGSTSEIGIYEMIDSGLREVDNPSEILLTHREKWVSGVAIGATIEGIRPLMIETQSLVSPAAFGVPQRSTTGYDQRRLQMLIAVLEKRAGFRLGTQDVFLNIAGGLRVEDPAIDLAVCMAILSSYLEKPVNPQITFASEVGLTGEIRPVSRIESRIAEAEKLGFGSIVISKYNKKPDSRKNKFEIIEVTRLDEAVKILFD